MDAITFRATVGEEQVIRPPADVQLPQGTFEVTVKPVASDVAALSRDAANARLRKARVSLGHPTGIDNEKIDADLARVCSDDHGGAGSKATP